MMRKIDFMVQISSLLATRAMKKRSFKNKTRQVVQSPQGWKSVDLVDADF